MFSWCFLGRNPDCWSPIMPIPRGLDPSLMQVNNAALHLIGCCQMRNSTAQEKESTQGSLLSPYWDSVRTEMESSETWAKELTTRTTWICLDQLSTSRCLSPVTDSPCQSYSLISLWSLRTSHYWRGTWVAFTLWMLYEYKCQARDVMPATNKGL